MVAGAAAGEAAVDTMAGMLVAAAVVVIVSTTLEAGASTSTTTTTTDSIITAAPAPDSTTSIGLVGVGGTMVEGGSIRTQVPATAVI